MPNQLSKQVENSPPENKKQKKIVIGILIFLVIILGTLFLWLFFGRFKITKTASAFQMELPAGINKENLTNPTNNDRLKIEENLSQVITARAARAKVTRESVASQPIYLVITQNGQPIIPGTTSPTTAITTTFPVLDTLTPSPASLITPTPTKTSPITPTPLLGPCTDSDGGFNIYTKGTVTQPGHFLSPFVDYCTEIDGISYDKAYLIEYTCEENYWKMNTYDCPSGCSDGACQQEEAPTPVPETCSDTDVGDKPSQYGEVSWRSNIYKDNCFSAQTGEQFSNCTASQPFCRLAENYCNQVNVAVVRTYQCPNGCSSGTCVGQPPSGSPTPVPYVCSDSDGGYNYFVKGTLTDKANHPNEDYCLGTQKLVEYACIQAADGSGVYNPLDQYYKQNYNCSYRCSDGVCISPPATPTPNVILTPTTVLTVGADQCFDSDGGKNYAVKGQTRPAAGYSVVLPSPTVSTDKYTYNADQQVDNSGSSGRSSEKYDYTEDGENHETNNNQSNNTEKYTYNADQPADNSVSDTCLSGVTLKEYFCHSDGKKIEAEEHNCEGECRDGACLANIPAESRSRAGFSVSGQAQDEYQNNYHASLIDDINKIYHGAKKKYPNLQLRKVNFVLSTFGLNLPNYFNASTNEIVLQKGKIPSSEELTWLVMASLQEDLASLPVDKLNKEINKIPSKEVSQQLFTPVPSKNKSPTSMPTSASSCNYGWQDYPKEKYGFKMKIPPGWTADISPKITETDSFTEVNIVSTTRPEEQMDPRFQISTFLIAAAKDDVKTMENYQGMFENNTGNQKKTVVDFKGIPAEKNVDETEVACGGQVNGATNCGHRFELYYFKKGDFYYLLSLGIYLTPDLKEQNESILKCFLDSFELTK